MPADHSATPAAARTGRPPRTSRAQILTAARTLIDRDGWQTLSMRRLAAELGTAPTTLYHHIRDKQDLLVQLLNDSADRLERPALPTDPRQRILAAATVMHDGLAAAPWMVEVLTADAVLGDSALWMVEAMIDGAIGCGLTPEDAVHLYRTIWYYTVGEILVRANTIRHRPDPQPDYRQAVMGDTDRNSAWPRLAALADRWPQLTAQDTYATGLRAIVHGMLDAN